MALAWKKLGARGGLPRAPNNTKYPNSAVHGEACWEFTAEVLILYHSTTIQVGYEAVVHAGACRQSARIEATARGSGDLRLSSMVVGRRWMGTACGRGTGPWCGFVSCAPSFPKSHMFELKMAMKWGGIIPSTSSLAPSSCSERARPRAPALSRPAPAPARPGPEPVSNAKAPIPNVKGSEAESKLEAQERKRKEKAAAKAERAARHHGGASSTAVIPNAAVAVKC